jgi:ribosomal protein L12E/L44/L45/RPP1/RPP2
MVQGSDIEEVIAKALRHVAANEAAAARRAQMLG